MLQVSWLVRVWLWECGLAGGRNRSLWPGAFQDGSALEKFDEMGTFVRRERAQSKHQFIVDF